MEKQEVSLKGKASAIGWRYAILGAVVMGIQILGGKVAELLVPEWLSNNEALFALLMVILSVDVVGFPLLILLTAKMPANSPEKNKMGFGKFLICVLMASGLCAVGMIIGNLIHFSLTLPFGVTLDDVNYLGTLMMNTNPFIRVLTVGILAPIFEELIFRKFLIDRVASYGEFAAILLSGFLFGVYHGNFQQFFYATALGMFFAFIYLKTGNVWYTILLHMIINLSSSLVTISLSTKITELGKQVGATQTEAETAQIGLQMAFFSLLFFGWLLIMLGTAIAGFVMLIVKRKSFCVKLEEGTTKKEIAKNVFSNPGMYLFYVFGIVMFLWTYLPNILKCFFPNLNI